jgi:Family of unknown function (DUF5724)/Domain of unknown function (DUF4132)
MPNPADAKPVLPPPDEPEWEERMLERAKKLPAAWLRDVEILVDRQKEEEKSDDDTAGGLSVEDPEVEAKHRVFERLDALPVAERIRLFTTLLPEIGTHVETGWQWLKQSAYQEESGFRAPRNPEATLVLRGNWLCRILEVAGPWRRSLPWLAAWAPHLNGESRAKLTGALARQFARLFGNSGAEDLGKLFAAAMEENSAEAKEITDILHASARGEHATGAMGHHVVTALLGTEDPEGWAVLEEMLLNAKLEDDLRGEILGGALNGHPEAGRRFLGIALKAELTRFDSVVRLLWDLVGYGRKGKYIVLSEEDLAQYAEYLNDSKLCSQGLESAKGEEVYLALLARGYDDVFKALPEAIRLLGDKRATHRFAAAFFLRKTELKPALEALGTLLADADPAIANLALRAVAEAPMLLDGKDMFERVETLLPKLPKKAEELNAPLWNEKVMSCTPEEAGDLLVNCLGTGSPERLLPHLTLLRNKIERVVQLLTARKPFSAETRAALLSLVCSPTSHGRWAAHKALLANGIGSAEAIRLEKLLDDEKKHPRYMVVELLLQQSDDDTLATADRLLSVKVGPRRQAGVGVLGGLFKSKRALVEVHRRAEIFRAAHKRLTHHEESTLEEILAEPPPAAGADLLGWKALFGRLPRSKVEPPKGRKVQLHSATSAAIFASLGKVYSEHAQKPVTYVAYYGEPITDNLASANFRSPEGKLPLEEEKQRWPLIDVWAEWHKNRGAELRDADGLELVRAIASFEASCRRSKPESKEASEHRQEVFGKARLEAGNSGWNLRTVLLWLLRLHPPGGLMDFLLDAAETQLACVPAKEIEGTPSGGSDKEADWRKKDSLFVIWLELAKEFLKLHDSTDEHRRRLWKILRWVDEPNEEVSIPRCHPEIDFALEAFHLGAATEGDIADLLTDADENGAGSDAARNLSHVTARRQPPLIKDSAVLRKIVDQVRDRILEVEFARADKPTPASKLCFHLESVWGIKNFAAILRLLGASKLVRGYCYDEKKKAEVLSHLLKQSWPLPSDTASAFKAELAAAKISQPRLVEVAFFAQQWASLIEEALGWTGFADGLQWIKAHTREAKSFLDEEEEAEMEVWKSALARQTTLSAEDLLDGAVDVGWFQRAYAALGQERWGILSEAAKYGTGGTGHVRARLFADAMAGRVKKQELVDRITKKQHQDAARALGLLPLAAGKSREKDLEERYRLLVDFARGLKDSGPQRRASEKRAAQIGQENLARLAGFADPIRLQWEMEARAISDLAEGPLLLKRGDITASLEIDPWGEIQFTVSKDGKAISELPPALKKDREFVQLRERRTELRRQSARIRPALEQFMVRGDTLTTAELADLMNHPFLAPMLRGLVLVGDGAMGYPVRGGKGLEDASGKVEALKKEERLRIAHPLDFLPTAKWHAWQKECFAHERIQPFKQVFREVYVPVKGEFGKGATTERYAGQKVKPRQALALLGKRGWVRRPEENLSKVFHEANLIAWVEFEEYFRTLDEVDELTVVGISFERRSGSARVDPAEIPPRIFSETMRDIDLMVSVAYLGTAEEEGPKISAAVLQTRTELVRNTCAVLGLKNVKLEGNCAVISGQLGNYSVHLGSGVTRKLPGEMLFLVAVHPAQRGKLFLPFADEDPKTAEVISKVIMLARDHQIRDPNILEQIRI